MKQRNFGFLKQCHQMSHLWEIIVKMTLCEKILYRQLLKRDQSNV
jgi:hypothetical protein